MKKLLPILILLAFVAFCYQIVVTFFITEHSIEYSLITSDQEHFTIFEEYQKRGDFHQYSFLVQNKKDVYTFSVEEDFNKQDRVITDIKYYKRNNLECIFPIYKRDYTADVSCLLDGEQVSPYYLTQTDNKDFSDISKKFIEEGYEDIFYNYDITPQKEGNLSIYYDFIPDDFIFAVWNYRGIDIITADGFEEKNFLNDDYYENTLSTVAGKYYVTVNTDNEAKQLNYYQLILYNLQDGGKSLVEVDLSQDSYFNGVYRNQVYITDPKEEKQYVLDPASKEITEVSDVKEISNAKLQDAGADFFDSPKVDSGRVVNKKITSLYDTEDIQKDNDNFYFKTVDQKLYKVVGDNYDYPVLLCQFEDMKEWQAHDDGVSFIVNDTLYFYSDFYGLKPILINSEFQYNSENIYHFIREV